MTRSRFRSVGETLGVALLWVLLVGAILTPPHPLSQAQAVAVLTGGSLVGAVALVAAGYDRIRLRLFPVLVLVLSVTLWAAIAGSVADAVGASPYVGRFPGVAVGTVLGVWLAYHGGLVEIRNAVEGLFD